jgi:hypothetical protein
MTRNRDTDIVCVEHISEITHVLRGHRVILGKDLATIYGVQTRALNQAVKRNSERFPQDFRFAFLACNRDGELRTARRRSFKITNCDLKN